MYLSTRGSLLSLLGCFIGRDITRFEKKYVRKILVIRMGRLGDFVVTTPLLKALRKEFPSSKITLLGRKDICELAKKQPWIDDVITYDKTVSLSVFLKLVRKAQKGAFDLAIDCLKDYPLRTAILAYLTHAPHRLGFDIAKRGVFFNLKAGPGQDKGTVGEEMLDLAAELGIIPLDKMPEIVVSSADKSAVIGLMKVHGIREESFVVGIHPGGHYPSQRWDSANFVSLIDRLAKKFSIDMVLLGNNEEAELLRSIRDKTAAKTHIFCTESLSLLAALIGQVKLFIGNNSGPLHLAAALGKKTVSTLGPTDSRLWAPAGRGHIVLKKEVSCSPCNRPICEDHRCMELITVDDMFEAASLEIERIKKVNG